MSLALRYLKTFHIPEGDEIYTVALTADAQQVFACPFARKTVYQWSIEAISHVRKWECANEHFAVSPSGNLLATITGTERSSIALWRLSDGSPFSEIVNPDGALIHCIAFSHDGETLYLGHQKGMALFDLKTEMWRQHIPVGGTWGVFEIHPVEHGGTVVMKCYLDIQSWTGEANSKPRIIGSVEANTITVSSDSRIVASCDAWAGQPADTVQIWDIQRAELIQRPKSAPIVSLAFTRDGSLLLGGTDYGGLQVWRTSDYDLIQAIPIHDSHEPVWALARSACGEKLATGCGNEVKLWSIE
jgi:WD40 repeat protein